jgi:hypothetical protein
VGSPYLYFPINRLLQRKELHEVLVGSFWTLGIPYKTLAGIGSIPACFITMQKVKNPDF